MKLKPTHILILLLLSNMLTLAIASQIFADGFENADVMVVDVDGVQIVCADPIVIGPTGEAATHNIVHCSAP